MSEDAELLRRYVEHRSDADFTALVQRHLGLVHGCALRRVGHDLPLAEDVTQEVFCALARKAPSLVHHPSLAGWLFVATQHTAAAAVRRERRRISREHRVTTMEEILHAPSSELEPDWPRLRPLLDDLILELKDQDRTAVALRFFEQRSFAEVGRALRLTEDTARKRVDRAVEKLRAGLAERGVTSSTAALAFALSEQAAASVPAALAAKVSAVALAELAASGSGGLAALVGVLLSGTTAVVATLVAAAGLVAWQHQTNARLQAELAGLGGTETALRATGRENAQLARQVAEADDLKRLLATMPRPVDPDGTPSSSPMAAPVTIHITPRGTLLWENQPVALDDYLKRLTALQAQHPEAAAQVVVRADPGAQFSAAAYAVEQASRADIRHIVVESPAVPDPSDSWITPPPATGANDLPPPSIPDSLPKP